MFPHKLDGDGYLREGFLRGSGTTLECYNDGKLVNHGSITLKLQHYSNNSFQDHQFYFVETPTCKEILVGCPASVRLGLIQVLCKNIAESVTATEAKPSNLTRIRNIDGRSCRQLTSRSEPSRVLSGWEGHKTSSFQDPCIKTGKENTKWVPFKTPFPEILWVPSWFDWYVWSNTSLSRPPMETVWTDNMTKQEWYEGKGSFQDPTIWIELNHSIPCT